eukprot:3698852-Amphidinium_carterae.1
MKGVVPRKVSDEEILERLFFPLINEGFKIIEEGHATRLCPSKLQSRTCTWTQEVHGVLDHNAKQCSFGELVPVTFTGLGLWGMDLVMNRGGMILPILFLLIPRVALLKESNLIQVCTCAEAMLDGSLKTVLTACFNETTQLSMFFAFLSKSLSCVSCILVH